MRETPPLVRETRSLAVNKGTSYDNHTTSLAEKLVVASWLENRGSCSCSVHSSAR